MEHTFIDPEDGVSYTVTPQSPRVLQGVGAPLAREVLRLIKELSAVAVDRDRIGAETRAAAKEALATASERERKLREAAIEFLGKALTVQRRNTSEWMEYIRDAGNAFAASLGVEGRVEIDGDRLTLHARFAGVPITDPVELAWCEFARRRAERGLPVEMRDQAVSIASFEAGVKWEAARVRRELLDAITAWRRTAFQGAGEGERHRGANVAIGVTLAALDRIIPEER